MGKWKSKNNDNTHISTITATNNTITNTNNTNANNNNDINTNKGNNKRNSSNNHADSKISSSSNNNDNNNNNNSRFRRTIQEILKIGSMEYWKMPEGIQIYGLKMGGGWWWWWWWYGRNYCPVVAGRIENEETVDRVVDWGCWTTGAGGGGSELRQRKCCYSTALEFKLLQRRSYRSTGRRMNPVFDALTTKCQRPQICDVCMCMWIYYVTVISCTITGPH